MRYTPMERAEAFIKAGELDDALEALNEQLASHPEDDYARRIRVQVLMRKNTSSDLQQALADLDALEHRTLNDAYAGSVIRERMGDIQSAIHLLEAALNDDASDERIRARTRERQLELMRKSGDIRKALAIALENDWVQWAADAAAELQDDALALEYYAQALVRVEHLTSVTSPALAANIKARVLLKRGAALQRLNQLDTADKDYAAAEAIIPDDPMITFNRGIIAYLQGHREIAQTQIKSAFDNAPAALQSIMRAEIQGNSRYQSLESLIDS